MFTVLWPPWSNMSWSLPKVGTPPRGLTPAASLKQIRHGHRFHCDAALRCLTTAVSLKPLIGIVYLSIKSSFHGPHATASLKLHRAGVLDEPNLIPYCGLTTAASLKHVLVHGELEPASQLSATSPPRPH